MKKIVLYIIVVGIFLPLFSACNDEWEDELYTRMVSFKAPINSDDVSAVYIRYKPKGEVTYKLPVIVSGSQENDQDLYVRIAIDHDTLGILNHAKYSTRKDLYYQQLPESFVEFPSETCYIPAGSSLETYDLNFKFEGLDLVEKWVLPLTIVEDPSYTMNRRKGWNKALLRIFPFNDYSGPYSATSVNIYFGNETDNPMNVATRTGQVVDENSIFFYAGITEEQSEDRGLYKIIVTFEEPEEVIEPEEPEEGEEGEEKEKEEIDETIRGKLSIKAENPLIGFELLSEPTYEIWEEMDPVSPYLLRRYVNIRLEYRYQDYTSASVPLTYTCRGTMMMQRNFNILVPDEDQAIQW